MRQLLVCALLLSLPLTTLASDASGENTSNNRNNETNSTPMIQQLDNDEQVGNEDDQQLSEEDDQQIDDNDAQVNNDNNGHNSVFQRVNQYLTDHPRVMPVTMGAIATASAAYLVYKVYQYAEQLDRNLTNEEKLRIALAAVGLAGSGSYLIYKGVAAQA
mgnify:CR=1 FL=1